MNTTPAALRPHIAFFGRRNAGKSSLVNQVTGQSLAVVSPRPGTTTDPVYKTMELLPAGPVVIIDTPGYDDEGALGDLRVEKTRQVLDRTDLAVLVIDAGALPTDNKAAQPGGSHACGALPADDVALTTDDQALLDEFKRRDIPYLVVYNKCDVDEGSANVPEGSASTGEHESTSTGEYESTSAGSPADGTLAVLRVSALTGAGITELKETIAARLAAEDTGSADTPAASGAPAAADGGTAGASARHRPLVADLIEPSDRIVLVIPIDESAPKGRIILPQQQVLREALDAGGIVTCCRPSELARTIQTMSAPQEAGSAATPSGSVPTAPDSPTVSGHAAAPALVITDSQAFREVAEILPEDTPLTSFSILMARYKGFLDTALDGIAAVANIEDGDRVLIAEGCTHHRQCNDIGTVKIPRWLREHTNAGFEFETVSGREFPEDLRPYKLVIHCGGCMITEREVQSRMRRTVAQGVPFLNYGVLIAHMAGILERSIAPLPR